MKNWLNISGGDIKAPTNILRNQIILLLSTRVFESIILKWQATLAQNGIWNKIDINRVSQINDVKYGRTRSSASSFRPKPEFCEIPYPRKNFQTIGKNQYAPTKPKLKQISQGSVAACAFYFHLKQKIVKK